MTVEGVVTRGTQLCLQRTMSKVKLAEIPALTFYKDALTQARRTTPIAQLTCLGKACKLYQPEVVRCVNLGGSGTDVDWKVGV